MALSLISLSATALGTRLLVLSVVWLPAVCAHVPDTHRCVPPHSQNYAFVIDCQAWKQKLALWGYLMLANKFLSNIREVDAIAHVVRCFEDSAVIHVENKLDPEDDIATIKTELELADLEMIEKHKAKMREKGKEEQKLQLLADKPVLYVLNVTHIGDNKIPKIDGVTVEVDATSGEDLDKLISKSYELLGLMSYFTTGEDETRAWTIKVGSTAPEAGAAVHTDFKDKFIRAEVVSYDDLMKSGSYARARELGLVRTEGRDYVVKDGDIIEFKI